MRAFLALATASLCLAQEPTAANLIQAGHWKRARTLVEQRLRESPDDANAVFSASQIRNAFGDRTSPPGLAEKPVRLDGCVARYHRQLAEVQGLRAQHALVPRFPGDARPVGVLPFAPGLMGGDSKRAEAMVQQIGAVDAAEGFLAARIAEFHKNDDRMQSMLRAAAGVRPVSYRALLA